MSEQVWVVIEPDGTVSNLIVADKGFVANLKKVIPSEDHETGDYHSGQTFEDVTHLSPRPQVGAVKKGNSFVPPPEPEPWVDPVTE